ncbi:MAG: EAL domain-containing protein [Betaproteobacteria bacterium]|nr:EAL domain-containing protein [Betaproteobacteria bacterium]
MKPYKRGGKYADLYRMAAAVATAVLLGVVFVVTQPVDLRRHNTLLGYFSQLQWDDARLGEAVLQLHFNLANNYDQVTAISRNMRDIARELRSGEAARDLHEDAEFQQHLQLLEQQLSAQQDALERFKSSNSVLKNSLAYLPHARDELEQDLPRGTAIHEDIDSLVEEVLFKRFNASIYERDHLEASVAALEKATAKLTSSTRKKLDNLLRQIRQIDKIERDMPALIRQLAANGENEHLGEAYRHYYDRQQQRAAAYRFFLLLATLSMLGYAAFVFLRLREKSRSLQLSASVIAHAHEGILITDTTGAIVDVNPAFTEVTGYTRKEVLGKTPRLLQSGRHGPEFYAGMWQSIKGTGRWSGEIWNRRKNGEIFPEWLSITTVTGEDGEVTHYVGSGTDITKRKQSEADIHNLSFYDPLTQLPNRRMLMDHLYHALVIGTGGTGHGALLFVGLDNFKVINDTKGHGVGDLLLIRVASRLKTCVGEEDIIARLGEDEFVVVLENLSEEAEQAKAQARMVAEKILGAIRQPYNLQGHEYHTTISIGIGLFCEHEMSVNDLLKRTDTAMHQAKQSGRNMLCFFDPTMQDALEERMVLESDLRAALQQRQFRLYYQMQVDHTGRIIGAEVLLRWMHPAHGLVSPLKFIPLAEEIGLILPIGQWVLETACKQIKAWEADPHTRDLQLAVNVSAGQFHQPDFVKQVGEVLNQTAVIPSLLKLELTESMVLDDIADTIAKMHALKQMGVRFSMDDFGTGYSSLAYLTQLPLDQLKIDQSFVRNIGTKSTDAVIVQTIVGMAGNLGMEVLAEGVETQAQRDFLERTGCMAYQGYLFSKPVPLEEFENKLKSP